MQYIHKPEWNLSFYPSPKIPEKSAVQSTLNLNHTNKNTHWIASVTTAYVMQNNDVIFVISCLLYHVYEYILRHTLDDEIKAVTFDIFLYKDTHWDTQVLH